MTSSAPTKRPPAADPLSVIAPLLRVRPEIQAICRFAARWEAEHQAEASARTVTAMLMAPARAWTLDALAAEARVSRATLVRIFRKAAGLAPLAFLSELRLEFARHRLASTNINLGKLAAEVGYDSESSFARAFRRRFGVSPGRSRSSGSGD